MNHSTIKRRARLALVGGANTPKLFTALQIAYGISGDHCRTIVVDASGKADRYCAVLGEYKVVSIHPEATPDRYWSTLNLLQGIPSSCVIILNLSDVWRNVTSQMNSFAYQDLLRSHRSLLQQIKFSAVHIIALVDSEKKLAYRDQQGGRKLHYQERLVQHEGVLEQHFTTILRIDKKGCASTLKDLSGVLPKDKPFTPNAVVGASLQDWSAQGKPVVPPDLQRRIDACQTLEELYQLLFSEAVDDCELVSAFTLRRLELESARDMALAHEEDYPF